MSVSDAFGVLVLSLDNATAEVEVLVAAGWALALEIDVAQLADANGKTRTASAAVTALRGLVADLVVKGRAVVADTDEADAGWITPTVVDLAPVRNAKESGASVARARGRRGGKAAP